jgi:hypothetical protein
LLFSQLVTLYLTPVVFTYMDGLQEKLGHLSLSRLVPRINRKNSKDRYVPR